MRRGPHDVGGITFPDQTIDWSEEPEAPWQVEFTAVLWALIGRENRVMTIDEMRRGVEGLSPAEYDTTPYYDRQTLSVASALVERGHLTWDELGQRIEQLKAEHTSREESP